MLRPRIDRVTRRRYVSAAVVITVILVTTALVQPDRAAFEPLHARYSLDWWRSPIEENAFTNVPYVDVTFRGVAASADGRSVMAVGDGGAVVHSGDGGKTWASDSMDGAHMPMLPEHAHGGGASRVAYVEMRLLRSRPWRFSTAA
jgi:hypothetical protein